MCNSSNLSTKQIDAQLAELHRLRRIAEKRERQQQLELEKQQNEETRRIKTVKELLEWMLKNNLQCKDFYYTHWDLPDCAEKINISKDILSEIMDAISKIVKYKYGGYLWEFYKIVTEDDGEYRIQLWTIGLIDYD